MDSEITKTQIYPEAVEKIKAVSGGDGILRRAFLVLWVDEDNTPSIAGVQSDYVFILAINGCFLSVQMILGDGTKVGKPFWLSSAAVVALVPHEIK